VCGDGAGGKIALLSLFVKLKSPARAKFAPFFPISAEKSGRNHAVAPVPGGFLLAIGDFWCYVKQGTLRAFPEKTDLIEPGKEKETV